MMIAMAELPSSDPVSAPKPTPYLTEPFADVAAWTRYFLEVEMPVLAATSLALILHELATNAAKYGALSASGGTVAITGARRDDRFALEWQERGGPEVAGPPQRRGFGAILAERGAITQLGGSIVHDWAPAGLTLRLEFLLARLTH